MNRGRSILVIGYGNPGRLDDGLGPALADALEALKLPGVTVRADYQLTVEDAAAAAGHDAVVFADASVTGEGPFSFAPVTPTFTVGFTSHSVTPSTVLGLARELFDAGTRGWVLGVRGYRFDAYGERLSRRARRNLETSLQFLRGWLGETTHEHPSDLTPAPVARDRDG